LLPKEENKKALEENRKCGENLGAGVTKSSGARILASNVAEIDLGTFADRSMEKTELFSFKARRSPAVLTAAEGTASRVWPGEKNEKAKADSRTTTRRMRVRLAPSLLGGMRTNTNHYVSCASFAKGCYRLVWCRLCWAHCQSA
jgi:hypothetical protein